MGLRIAISGKGGVGKTTIAGTLARALARRGQAVLAVDCDATPNLAVTLGFGLEPLDDALAPLPATVLERRTGEDGQMRAQLTLTPHQIIEQYGKVGPDGVRCLVMARVDHAGAGWVCRAHSAVRVLTAELIQEPGLTAILDMEAGLEHLSRGTGRHVDVMLVVLEPYYKALEIGARAAALARDLGIQRVYGVANKLRDDADRQAVASLCARYGLDLVAAVPHDPAVVEADREGRSLMDVAPGAAATREIERLADWLLTSIAAHG